MRRIVLLLVTNLAVLAVLTIVPAPLDERIAALRTLTVA